MRFFYLQLLLRRLTLRLLAIYALNTTLFSLFKVEVNFDVVLLGISIFLVDLKLVRICFHCNLCYLRSVHTDYSAAKVNTFLFIERLVLISGVIGGMIIIEPFTPHNLNVCLLALWLLLRHL